MNEISFSVKIIEGRAFNYFISLVKVVIPPSTTKIPRSIFDHCSSIKEIEIPSSVKKKCYKISENIFY